MSEELIITIMQNAMITVVLVAGPILIAALIVGVMVSIFQSVTNISDMTLTFIPKMLAVFLTFLFLFPWFLRLLRSLAIYLLSDFSQFIG